VTVSSSRYFNSQKGEKVTDESGDVAAQIVKRKGHELKGRLLISDDAALLRSALAKGLSVPGADVILFTGGTGLSPTDITVETLRPSFEKEIEGFGEIFRSVSYAHIGAAAALSRATAGIASKKVVLCLPGSPDAVKTALNLFTEEIPHIVYLARGA
jgi:molybdopterin adenylyltransferase